MTLNLGRTLSSGHGSVSFSSDEECTQFVNNYFPTCATFLSSCKEVKSFVLNMCFITIMIPCKVENDKSMAGMIVGCLFSQYPSLMVPLLDVEREYTELFNII